MTKYEYIAVAIELLTKATLVVSFYAALLCVLSFSTFFLMLFVIKFF